MSEDLFKFQLKQEIMLSNKKIKAKKSPAWLFPTAIENRYINEILKIIKQFVNITVQEIKPLLSSWNQENKIISGDHFDSPTDDLSNINKQFEEQQNLLFGEESNLLRNILLSIAGSTLVFNNKQWQKILKSTTNTNLFLNEVWQNELVKQWINNNVNLIKGMTNDYVKKINNAVLQAFQKNQSVSELAKTLTKINKEFATGDFKWVVKNGKKIRVRKQSRAIKIARDQLGKLNGSITRKRQKEVGVNIYIWRTALDERVRGNPGGQYPNAKPSHWVMEGKYCSWDNPSVYADTLQDAIKGNWKKRSSIGGPDAHPQEEINCRCFGEAVFDKIIGEVNNGIRFKRIQTH